MIPLYKPYMPDSLPEIHNILYSGALSYGKWGKEFEQSLAKYIGNPNIITVNSFNSAIHILLSSLGIHAGDEIISSPMSCLASNQPLITYGINVKWADIDPKTGTLCPESVRSKITNKTKAIFHNHFCGYIGYVDEINKIAKEKGIYVIDDSIEAFGSELNNKKIGNIDSDATVFSFQTVRLPNTIDGGAISFKSKKHYDKAVLVRDFGIDRTNFRDELNEINPNCDISIPGYGATLSEINSYIGFEQMKSIDKHLHIQRKNANKWEKILSNESNIKCIQLTNNTNPNYWIFGLLSENKIETIKEFREKGFYASGVHLPNNYYSVFGKQEELKGVNEFYSKFIALPCGWWAEL